MLADRFRKFDWVLLGSVALLTAFGLAVIYSTSLSSGETAGDLGNFWKQLIFAACGLVLALVMVAADYRQLTGYTRALYLLGLSLLVAVLIFGKTVHGTTGWFGFGGLGLQPVELVKIILIIFLAKYFADRARGLNAWRPVIGSGLAFAGVFVLVALQPDFGSAAITLVIWASLLLVSGAKRKQVLALAAVALLAAVVAWFFVLTPIQKARIVSFVNPAADQLSAGWNVNQSVIAVGSGGLFGQGLGYGSQSQLRFLPERQTDFIFAAAAEAMGFVGVMAICLLFAAFFWRCSVLARDAGDDFTVLLVLGITAVVATEFFINIGGNLRLLPVTGITLPFMSYGGSSLIAKFLMIGLLESVAVRR